MRSAPYPSEFFVVHRLFTGKPFAAPTWGSLSDGPYDRTEALDCIADSFHGEEATLDNLRVWHFQPDVPARDVTEDMIALLVRRAA